MSAWVFAIGLHAQSDEEQVLVFRHSGEVNLFYASQLDRIELSAYDADSVLHDEVVSQVFYADDTTMVVPIAEIDSVAFGSRNAIEMRPNVKEMTAETDLPWILRFDGEAIYYRLNTPANILPKVGQRLFYGLDGDTSEAVIFPYGLTAKATAVTTLADEIRVDIENVELNEIFSKFFYAGPIYEEKMVEVNGRKASAMRKAEEETHEFQWDGMTLNAKIPLGKHGELTPGTKLSAKGQAVIQPLRFYTHTDIDVSIDLGVDFKIYARDKDSISVNTFHDNYTPFATLYNVINFGVAAGLFIDAKAEMALEMGAHRTFLRRVSITRTFDDVDVKFAEVPGEEGVKDTFHAEVMLDGTIYLGAIMGLEVTFVGKVLGARANIKYGPEFEAKVSGKLLSDMHEYSPESYGLCAFTERNKFTLDGDLVYRRPWRKESLEMKNLFSIEAYGQEHTIDLLPQYEETRGVEASTQTTTDVTVSTKVENKIPHELETGFILLDKDDNIIDSIFVEDLIQPDTTMVQGFEASFELPKRTNPDTNPLRVSPIFHYAGYTIAYKDVNVLHDSHIMPITAYGTNGVATYISGASVVGTAKVDSMTYHIGNYLPIPQRDSVFFPDGGYESKTPGKVIDEEKTENLFGTWTGEVDGDMVTFTFNNDDNQTGTYIVGGKERSFTYKLNTPQSGDVSLLFDDQTVFMFTIVSVSDTTLVIHKKGKSQQYTMNKRY